MGNIVTGKYYLTVPLLLLLAITSIVNFVGAGNSPDEKNKQRVQKVAANDSYQSFTINNIFNYYSNNGDGSYNIYKTISGFEFPKGSSKTAVYGDGLLIGGRVRTSVTDTSMTIKVVGSAYRHGWQGGRIVTPGTSNSTAIADNPALPANRIYKVRPDINPSTNLSLAQQIIEAEELPLIVRFESGATTQKIYDQYIADWNEWPASLGAPFKDNNGNGTYEPTVDIPGIPDADQTLWHVSNDLDGVKTRLLYGSDPIGLEMQRTIWGYKQGGPLGNTIFTKYRIINKSGGVIDKAYIAQWSDPDLGGPGDDFAGCDTLLGLGFVYNGRTNDEQYGLKSPSIGYDFLQGPLVLSSTPGDSGKVNGQYVYGKKNLSMSSFYYHMAGVIPFVDPAQGNISGTITWYRQMQGLDGSSSQPFHEYLKPSMPITTFLLSGDPVAGTGWLDGLISSPGDRRIAICSGPFTMANGDTQEIVVGTIIAQDGDRLSSVSALKRYDKAVQFANDHNFIPTGSPPDVTVTVTNGDSEIVLDWGNEQFAKIIESFNCNGYTFQGYNVYQSPTDNYSPYTAKRLATFDIIDGVGFIQGEMYDSSSGTIIVKPVQFGQDSGIQRTYTVKTDTFTRGPLVNGRNYYFFVTAYCYNPNPDAVPRSFETGWMHPVAIPQSRPPGVRYGKNIGDTLHINHSSGISSGTVNAIVVDPSKLTGHDYTVTFDTSNSNGAFYWKLTDGTLGKVLLDKQYNISGDGDYYTVDGLLIKVTGIIQQGMKPGVQGSAISSSPDIGFEIVTGVRAFTWAGNGSPFLANGMEGFDGGMGGGFQFSNFISVANSLIPASDIGDVLVEFAGTDTSGRPINPASDTVSLAYRYVRNGLNAPADASFAPFLPPNTPSPVGGSLGFIDRRPSPIRVYEWNSATQTKGQRLNFGFLENNIAKSGSFSGGRVDGLYWPATNGQITSYVSSTDPREWLFIFRSTYDAVTPDPQLTVNLLSTATPMIYWWTVARNGQPWGGNSYKLISFKPLIVADIFTFTAPASTSTVADAKADAEKINVYPNPYFRFNSQERSPSHRFVTFNHLPQKATIRIFTLAGILVKTIIKDDVTQFAQWDLRNHASNAASAGLYIIHIEMPEIGKSKILKLAIIPSAQLSE